MSIAILEVCKFLVKHNLIKSSKITTQLFKWLTTNTISQMKNFFNLIIMLLFFKKTYNICLVKFLNPLFTWYCFNKNLILNELRNRSKLFLPPAKSFRPWLNFAHFIGSVLWKNLSSSVKDSETFSEFKVKLKNLGNIHCTWQLCVIETCFFKC